MCTVLHRDVVCQESDQAEEDVKNSKKIQLVLKKRGRQKKQEGKKTGEKGGGGG